MEKNDWRGINRSQMKSVCPKTLCIHVGKILQPDVLGSVLELHRQCLVLERSSSNPDVQTSQSYK